MHTDAMVDRPGDASQNGSGFGHDEDSPRRRWEQGDDLDAEERRAAAREIGRRAAIWIVPLTLVAILITALGIPWWISFLAMALVMAILVFEIDF
jgi:4-hydroxybenzoate polyprenyltransferase